MSVTEQQARLPHHVVGAKSPGWWGMVLLIATEATLFGILIASYFFIRFNTGDPWPPSGVEKPDLVLPLIMTAILVTSSFPMHFADRAIREGNTRRLKLGLALTFLLGATFMGFQVFEYVEKAKELTPTTNVYGSLFYTITGFHGLHVFVGLVLVLWAAIRASMGHFDRERHTTIQNVAMYWHFVDAVWIVVLSTIYLSPNL